MHEETLKPNKILLKNNLLQLVNTKTDNWKQHEDLAFLQTYAFNNTVLDKASKIKQRSELTLSDRHCCYSNFYNENHMKINIF